MVKMRVGEGWGRTRLMDGNEDWRIEIMRLFVEQELMLGCFSILVSIGRRVLP